MPFFKFICTTCGHRDEPCEHFEEKQLRKDFREIRLLLLEVIHLLNAPKSATLKLTANPENPDGK